MIKIGAKQESIALKFLQQKGLKLITKNFRSKIGEIDLIMHDTTQIIFIEVRYRNLKSHGTPAETVNYTKQQKIIKTSTIYLIQNNLYDKVNIRFDIISINNDPVSPIEWIKNAF